MNGFIVKLLDRVLSFHQENDLPKMLGAVKDLEVYLQSSMVLEAITANLSKLENHEQKES